MNRSRRGTPRRGVFLIDTVVSITIGSVLMFSAVLLLVRLLSVGPAAQRQLEERMALDRLGAQLRRDVHAATEVQNDEPALLAIARGQDAEVRYRITDDGVDRLELSGGKIQARDRFRLPVSKMAWRVDKDAAPPEVTLALTKFTGPDQRLAGTNFELHATIGRDERMGRE